MSGNRTMKAPPRLHVKGHCRWCGEPVPPPKRTFCSTECVHEWRIRTDPGYVREQLWKRDHGVCASCGLDTVEEARTAYKARSSRPYPDERGKRGPWDADHIHPVHRGGGECGLDGYQTLCKECHKAKSAEEARVRAEAKRPPSGQMKMDEAAS